MNKYASFFWFFLVLVNPIVFAQSNPVPLLYQPLSPASITPGHAGFTLRVHGTGFRAGAVVKWNGHPLKTVFLSNSALRADVPAGAVAKPATGSVTVANPGTIVSNVIYLPVRWSSSTVTVATDPAVIETGEAVVGDFNNDSKPDTAVANNTGSDEVFPDVYLGLGGGKFTKVQGAAFPFGRDLNVGNIAADFNNDGNLDLTICDQLGNGGVPCSIFLGDGKGGLTYTNLLAFGPAVAADVNGDGNLDAIATPMASLASITELTIYLGNGDGTFRIESIVDLNDFGGLAVLGDFNGDGRLDVAIPTPHDNVVAVLLGNGDGTFQSEIDYPAPAPFSAVVTDVNGDGKLDIVSSGSQLGAGGVAVLLGNGDGTFGTSTSLALPCGADLNIADLNGDGKLDLVTLSTDNAGNQTVNIALGNGDGTFQSPLALPAPNQLIPSGLISIADFNNDGHLDFVISGSLNPCCPTPGTVLLQTRPK